MTIPRPPVCMRASMTACPNLDQQVAVSLTTSPVTHTADVDVKRAVSNEALIPSLDETGSMRRKAPIRIAPRKPRIMIWKDDSFFPNK